MKAWYTFGAFGDTAALLNRFGYPIFAGCVEEIIGPKSADDVAGEQSFILRRHGVGSVVAGTAPRQFVRGYFCGALKRSGPRFAHPILLIWFRNCSVPPKNRAVSVFAKWAMRAAFFAFDMKDRAAGSLVLAFVDERLSRVTEWARRRQHGPLLIYESLWTHLCFFASQCQNAYMLAVESLNRFQAAINGIVRPSPFIENC